MREEGVDECVTAIAEEEADAAVAAERARATPAHTAGVGEVGAGGGRGTECSEDSSGEDSNWEIGRVFTAFK